MRKNVLRLIATAGLAAGCVDFGAELTGPFFGSTGCTICGIVVVPPGSHFVVGDTVKVWALGGSEADSVRWSVSNSTFRFVDADSSGSRPASARDTAFIVAQRKGTATLGAATSAPGSQVMLSAVDSADVDALRITAPQSGALRAGTSLDALAELKSGVHRASGRVTWSTSDTSVATVAYRPGTAYLAPQAMVQGRRIGSFRLRATFGGLRDSISMTVSP